MTGYVCKILGRWLTGVVLLLLATVARAGVSYVSSSVGPLSGGAVTSMQIPNPAGLTAGDLMVAFLSQRNPGSPMVSAASGWTAVLSNSYGGNIGAAVYYRFATAADVAGTGPTFGFTASSRSAGVILAFRGVDTANPVHVSASQGNAASTSMTAPSVTTTLPNTMLVALFANASGNAALTASTGMTEAFNGLTGGGPNGLGIEGAYAPQTAAGTTGTRVATSTAAVVNVGVLLALQPSLIAPDHLQIEFPGDGLTCAPSSVTVKACADAVCGVLYAGGVTGTLSPGGAAFAIGPSGVTTATVSSTVSPAVLSATSTPAAVNAPVCLNTATGAAGCSMAFNSAGFIFAGAPDGVAMALANQVAGLSSATYYLRAVRTSSSTKACEAALVGSNTVDMAYQCNNPGTCSGTNLMSINGGVATAIARNDNTGVTTYTPVSLTFDANGNAPLTLNYSDVGQVRLYASRAAGATAAGTLLSAVAGSSNAFVVRPAGFTLSNIKQTAAPQLLNPAAVDANGGRFVMAGESFTATVTATTATGAPTPNFGRELAPEGVLLTPALVLPAGGNAGAVSNALIAGGNFVSGVATVSNLSWSEVGILTLTPSVGSGSYLGAGNTVGTASGNIGRFYPAQFAVSGATLTNTCISATPYSYFGEDGFTTAFTLTAQNLAGGTTTNYMGAFAKLNLGTYASYGFSAAALPAGAALGSGSSAPTGVAPNSNWTNGVANVLARHVISRPTALAAQTAVLVSASPSDGDVPAGMTTALGSAAMRYGRLQLLNAYGSELLPLPMTLRAQYWNGSAWVVNADDSCTTVVAPTSGSGLTFYPTVAPGAPGNHLSAGQTMASVNASGKLAAGDAGLRFSAPGAGNGGYVDVSISLLTRPWLRFPWAGAGDADPSGRATFGIYKSRLIYSRENY